MYKRLYSIQEGLSTGCVSVAARPRGGDWLLDEVKAIREAGVDVLVSLLTMVEASELGLDEEAASCLSQEIVFLAFPILDFSVPPFSTATFAFLKQLGAFVSEGRHVAFHCRQGLGRSVLMAASVLLLNGFTPEQAFDRLSAVRGYQVPETEEQRTWVRGFYHTVVLSDAEFP